MKTRLSAVIGVALLAVLSLAFTSAVAAFALRGPDVEVLDHETASRLRADYSKDENVLPIEPISPELIDAAREDEISLAEPVTSTTRVDAQRDEATPTPEPTRDREPTPNATGTPAQEEEEPTATARPDRTATARPDETPDASATAPAEETVVAETPVLLTPVATEEPTREPVPTLEPTVESRPTKTFTVVPVKTKTPTSEPTKTEEPTETKEPTDTPTPAPPASVTPSKTPTRTITPSHTPTRTSTPTTVPTLAPTNTPTVTITPSYTPTVTNTALPTNTGTSTPTNTATPTDTATATLTPTPTDTPTPTATPTNTPLPNGTLSIAPQSQTVSPGAVFVGVHVTGAQNLGAYEFSIEWDGSVLAFVDVSNGSFLGSTGNAIACDPPAYDNSTAMHHLTFSCTAPLGLLGPSGNGTLAIVELASVSAGTTTLDLHDSVLTTLLLLQQPSQEVDGTVTVLAPTATPTPTPTPTAPPAPTDTPTATPTPTATLTPTPTPTSTPAGPAVVATFTSALDTYVREDSSTSSDGGHNDMHVDGETGKVNRAFVQFDISGLPSSATIVSATLTLCYKSDPAPGAAGHTHELRRVTAAWDENVTWDTAPAVSVVSGTITVPATAQCETIDVTNDVELWMASGNNFGWRISDAAAPTSASEAKYTTRDDGTASEWPKLIVTYNP
jgi:hypothetical protein